MSKQTVTFELTRYEAESLLPPSERTLLWGGSFGWVNYHRTATDRVRAALEEQQAERSQPSVDDAIVLSESELVEIRGGGCVCGVVYD